MLEFDGQGVSLDMGLFPGHNGSRNLGSSFSILFGLVYEECSTEEDQWVFGHSGVGGYGLKITKITKEQACGFVFGKIGSNDVEGSFFTFAQPVQSSMLNH